MAVTASTRFSNETLAVTGYGDDDEILDLLVAFRDSTGAGIYEGLAEDWARSFSARLVCDKTNLPALITIRSIAGPKTQQAVKDLVEAASQIWNPSSFSIPTVLRCADLVSESSYVDLIRSAHGFSMEATPTDVPAGKARPAADDNTHASAERLPQTNIDHSRLANELRGMTGLGAAALGAAFGVSREQYSRWANGQPISETRHGQLRFLHTLVRDLVRRLGAKEARLWLHTPIDGMTTPVDMIRRRRLDRLHRAIVEVPDPNPVSDGVLVALPIMEAPYGDGEESDSADEPWSPYAVGVDGHTQGS